MKVLVTGDFSPINRLQKLVTEGNPESVLSPIIPLFKEHDLVITNLECPITTSKIPIKKTGPALKADINTAKFLRNAGVNMVTLANNHIMDYGSEGLEQTFGVLKEEKINWVGAGNNLEEALKPVIFKDGNYSLGILNFAENEWSTTHGQQPGANPIDPVQNYQNIRELKSKVSKVLVITHGGHEMYNLPSPRMKKLFRFYAEAGADVVVNHHPHCVSGYELFEKTPIFYSIGNFLFDDPKQKSALWTEGVTISLQFNEDDVKFELIHFDQCEDNSILKLCNHFESKKREEKLQRLNKIINSDEKLEEAYKEWRTIVTKMYTYYIEPHSSRYVQALQNRGFLPTLWSKRKKYYLLNLIRCEAHRDILQNMLEHEIGHT